MINYGVTELRDINCLTKGFYALRGWEPAPGGSGPPHPKRGDETPEQRPSGRPLGPDKDPEFNPSREDK